MFYPSLCTNYISTISSSSTSTINGFKIFPNPANSEMIITSTNVISSLTVFNSIGQAMVSVQPNSNFASIDISHFSNGIYFVKGKVGDSWYTQKILKQWFFETLNGTML